MDRSKVAVVTGAGSGIGQATALLLARRGWRVAMVGRRGEALADTRAQAGGGDADRLRAFPCDVADEAAVRAMAEAVLESLGPVEVLVNAAGTNIPRRSLEELSREDYDRLIRTNLDGPYLCTQAFLPGMRQRGSGTVVNIVSDAAKLAGRKAGAAYVMAKAGLAGLTQAINAEESGRGIRASAIFPGEVDTPILDLRPAPPPPEARARMLRSEDVAACVLLVVELPLRAVVEEILIRPRPG